MNTCNYCRNLLLDYTYDLLEPAEAETVRTHMTGCAVCSEEVSRFRLLIAAASKSGFPNVSFTPPGALSSATRPVRTAHRTWLNWVVAASLLLAVSAAGGPIVVNTVGYAVNRPRVDTELVKVESLRTKKTRLMADFANQKQEAEELYLLLKSKQEELERNWISAEKVAVKKLVDQPYLLELTGPSTAIPGAPNTYSLRVNNADGTPVTSPVTVDATVKDTAGNELFTRRFTTDVNERSQTLKFPSGMWSNVAPGSNVFLHVSAVDKSGARSELIENLRLLEPQYTTFLTTDKPMYRPGETVFFRSLTLDRTRFLPPERDQSLRYEIKAPSGQVLAGSQLVGVTRPVRADATTSELRPVLGPDNKPIRGVGCGTFVLNSDLAGGEYSLNVYRLPTNGEFVNRSPLATRKFIINQYTPDKLLKKLEFDGKSYGPGDSVQARFDLKDQGKPLPDATIQITAHADGREIVLSANPTRTDEDGSAALRFTLPQADEIRSASVSVTVSTSAVTETLIRHVPLATRKLTLEFFPEGGELVAGVPNRVYFRATTSKGKPADVIGTLTDGSNDVTSIKTLTDPEHPGVNQGLGVFEFTPLIEKTYAIKLSKPFGLVQPEGGFQLLAAKKEGLVLSISKGVTKAGEPIRVKLHTTSQKQSVLVGAYIRGQSVAHQKATVEPGKPTDVELNPGEVKLGGVTRITVFELPDDDQVSRADLKPLAERLVFRIPGESLKLSYSVRKAVDGNKSGAFIPGTRMELDIRSQDETGAGKAAVLWAAVVNQSVITMADEKSERLLPTHFLLSGEVKKGDELEHADFLLTEHAKASEALDLLLGTQGWRRFAEQNPEQFRKVVPADEQNRLQLVTTETGPIPTGWRPAIRRVFDEYWPRYESSLAALEQAERNKDLASKPNPELNQLENQYQQALVQFGHTAVDLHKFDQEWERWRTYLPLLFMTLSGLLVTSLVFRQVLFVAGSPERRTMSWVAIVLLLLTGGIALSAIYTGSNNQSWRETWALSPKPERTSGAVSSTAPKASPTADMATPMAMEGAQAMPNAGQDKFAKKDEIKEMAQPMAMRAPPPAPVMAPAGPGVDPAGARPGNPNLMRNGFGAQDDERKNDQVVPMLLPDDRRGGGENRQADLRGVPGGEFGGGRGLGANAPRGRGRDGFVPDQFVRGRQVDRNRRIGEFNSKRFSELSSVYSQATGKPAQRSGQFNQISQVTQFLPSGQPLVIREYAHSRPVPSDDTPRTDFTETLLWQPVIVTQTDGKATLNFRLSDYVAPYRVLLAGHTLDGRIGATTGMIEVRKPIDLDLKLPQEVSSSDTVDVPVIFTNSSDATRKVDVTLSTIGLKVSEGDK